MVYKRAGGWTSVVWPISNDVEGEPIVFHYSGITDTFPEPVRSDDG